MGATGRGRDPHLIDALAGGAQRFTFHQVVRLLRAVHAARHADGEATNPGDGPRFRTTASLAHPTTAVTGIDLGPDGTAEVTVAALGLTGPGGVMPLRYTRDLIARDEDGEDATHAFFDIFNNRLIDLYYRAWERTKLHIRHERRDPRGPARRLLALAGLGTDGLDSALDPSGQMLTENAAAFFAGLMGQLPRSAQAVRQVLADLLGTTVEIQQFVGVWLTLPEGDLTRLGAGGGQPRPSATLGTAMLGAMTWDRRSTLRVRIGPLDRKRFMALLPTTQGPSPALRRLSATLSALLGVSTRVQIQLVLKAAEVPVARLSTVGEASDAPPPLLGLSTWFAGYPKDRDADETVIDNATG